MKIALLSAFYPYRGGIAQFSAMLYRALEKDHELKAYTFKRQYPNILFPGTTQFVTSEDDADPVEAARVLDSVNPISYGKTAKEILKDSPDVVISQYWMTFFGPAIGGVHKRLRGTKRISILHNLIPHEKRFFDNWANKKFLNHNEGFVVLSNAVLEDLLRVKPDANYLRIDHPVYNHFGKLKTRDESLSELGLPKDKKYILFFGIIRDYKGLDLLLDAMQSVDENIHLIIAGESYGSFEKYEEQIKRNTISERVHVYNKYIPDNEVAAYFCASEVCILPYKSATQSGITAISHHFELPIIATDVGGLKESVVHNTNGLIVEDVNSKAIAKSIQHYFEDNMAPKFKGNLLKIKQENTWENFSKKIVEFAKEI